MQIFLLIEWTCLTNSLDFSSVTYGLILPYGVALPLRNIHIIITKGDVRIEFPCDTDIGTVTNIIGALLC